MPPIPEEPEQLDESVPMFITPMAAPDEGGQRLSSGNYDGPRYAWCEIRRSGDGETISPFVRAMR